MCGDLTNTYPVRQENQTESPELLNQIKLFKELWGKVDPDIPLLCTCGNHDTGNVPNSFTLRKYNKNYGDDYYSFWAGGCKMIVLNSPLILHPEEALKESKDQSEWLDKELESLKAVQAPHVLVFMHHPLFVADPTEEDKSYSTVSPINFPSILRAEYMKKFEEAGVRAIFAGHYHRNAYGQFGPGIEMITTSAVGFQIGTDEPGMRIVKVYKDHIEHKYWGFEEVPSSIEL